MKITDHFYTMSETATRLQVERHTIARWIKDGRLEAQKAGGVVFIEKDAVRALEDTAAWHGSRGTGKDGDDGQLQERPVGRRGP